MYVLVPADKAAQNVIVVCKKYYLQIVLKEIVTCDSVMEDNQGIVDKHITYFTKHHIDVTSHYRCLSQFHWLPKLHKQPYGTRFIAVSHKCTMNPLPKLLTSCNYQSLQTVL